MLAKEKYLTFAAVSSFITCLYNDVGLAGIWLNKSLNISLRFYFGRVGRQSSLFLLSLSMLVSCFGSIAEFKGRKSFFFFLKKKQ